MSATATGPSAQQIAEDWVKFTVQSLQENIRKQKIVSTGDLLDSIKGEVLAAAGSDVLKTRITYAIYGMFVDMGAGRGMAAGVRRGQDGFHNKRNDLGQLLVHRRRPRQWYSREIGRQKRALGVLMSEFYGRRLIAACTDELPGSVTLDLKFLKRR